MKKLDIVRQKEIYGGKTYRCPNSYVPVGGKNVLRCKYTTTNLLSFTAHQFICPYKFRGL